MHNRVINSILLIVFGCGIGVLLSQFSYFTLSKEISLTEVIIAIFTGLIAIYIADDIAAKLSRSQNIKSLFTEDIKVFIASTKSLEDWVDDGECNAKDLKKYLKNGTVKLNTFIQIYCKHKGLNTNSLRDILNLFNNLKNDITEIPPSANGIEYKFNPAQQHKFTEQLNSIKVALLDAMVDA